MLGYTADLLAGLFMRMAFQMELKITHIPAIDLISTREGVHYPFGGSEMQEILRFLLDWAPGLGRPRK